MIAWVISISLLLTTQCLSSKTLAPDDILRECALTVSCCSTDISLFLKNSADKSFSVVAQIYNQTTQSHRDSNFAALLEECTTLYQLALQAEKITPTLDLSTVISCDELEMLSHVIRAELYDALAGMWAGDSARFMSLINSKDLQSRDPELYKQTVIVAALIYRKLAGDALRSLSYARADDQSSASATELGISIYQTYMATQDLPVEFVLSSLYDFARKFCQILSQMSSESSSSSFPSWFKTLWFKLPVAVVFVILRIIRFATTHEPSYGYSSYGGGGAFGSAHTAGSAGLENPFLIQGFGGRSAVPTMVYEGQGRVMCGCEKFYNGSSKEDNVQIK